MERAEWPARAVYAWLAVVLRMDRRAPVDAARRKRRLAFREMAACRRCRRCGADAKPAARAHPGARADRLCAKRRASAARKRLSAAADRAGFRGQHEYQMAAAAQADHGARDDARGNVEVHGSAARRTRAAIR